MNPIDTQTPALTSSAIENNEKIPMRYTVDGEDVSPPLDWATLPPQTAELVVVCLDPDAPTEQPWVHWVLYGLAPDTPGLPEDLEKIAELREPIHACQGLNSWGKAGYGGPAPPRGHGRHRYHFTLHALDKATGLEPGASAEQVFAAIDGHVLMSRTITGVYER